MKYSHFWPVLSKAFNTAEKWDHSMAEIGADDSLSPPDCETQWRDPQTAGHALHGERCQPGPWKHVQGACMTKENVRIDWAIQTELARHWWLAMLSLSPPINLLITYLHFRDVREILWCWRQEYSIKKFTNYLAPCTSSDHHILKYCH